MPESENDQEYKFKDEHERQAYELREKWLAMDSPYIMVTEDGMCVPISDYGPQNQQTNANKYSLLDQTGMEKLTEVFVKLNKGFKF